MKRCKDKLSRAGVYQALEDDVTDSGILILTRPIHSRPTIVLTYSAHFLANHYR
jgi:hypothetical protein